MPVYGGFAIHHGQTLGTVTISGFAMQILQLNWTGLHRDAIEVTNMNVLPTTSSSGLGNKMHIPSAYVEPGMLELTILHDPTKRIPITDPSDAGPTSITFTLGPSSSAQESFDTLGFLTDYTIDGPLDGKPCTATVKIKLTDSVDNTYDALGAIDYSLAS